MGQRTPGFGAEAPFALPCRVTVSNSLLLSVLPFVELDHLRDAVQG